MTPAADIARRVASSHLAGQRHAQGELSVVIPTAQSSPSRATGTPRNIDHELVVTAVQLMIPTSGHANVVGSV
jgi:hypothetical protein